MRLLPRAATSARDKWAEAVAWQAAEAQRRQREARLRWEYERRRSAAHARMPNTLYASTPSAQAKADFSCPALVDEDTRHIYRRFLEERRDYPTMPSPAAITSGKGARDRGIKVFSAHRQDSIDGPSSWSKSQDKEDPLNHLLQASAWAPTAYESKSASESTHHVYLVPSASEPLREGFVRVINHSDEAGEVMIDPIDDSGRQFDTIRLSIEANETVHFNSGDLEMGNEGKGLSGSTGSGEGDWRLAFSSDLDIEVLSYIRTEDGFLTAMHDVAPAEGNVHRVAIFNPGSNKDQVSRLRLINPTDGTAEVTIRGTDDKGLPGTGEISVSLDSGTAREITAEALESGDDDFDGMLGDGSGKWRLELESEQSIVAMSLLESPTDHLTNLSTVPGEPADGVYRVPLFPKAGDETGRQGFVRAINRSDTAGEISIKAYDETERDYETVTLGIGANEVEHFNSDDLEQGSSSKGLSGGVGAGEGDWRLELTSDPEIEVLSYIRTEDGFLTSMHDVAPSAGTRHRVAVFNPGSNRNQESLLRLVNPDTELAEVAITGIDDKGSPGESAVSLTLAAGGSRTVGAWELESGGEGLTGALGDGSGKWQLTIASDVAVVAISLLRSPTGHLTNLSTAPVRGAQGGFTQEPETAEAVFQQLISGPIVQSKCINCHVEGGASGNTRFVFVPDTNPDHEAHNLQVFRGFLDEVEDGANYVLNKIQGALGHGGGIQVAAGSEDYANMERFLSLLGEEVESAPVTVESLFDGVKMESPRSTLRRAAIVFAGRLPTETEYGSIRGASAQEFRAAIRNLMQGPDFHEFIIRVSNDRLLTDRELDGVLSEFLDNYTNRYYLLAEQADASGDYSELYTWEDGAHHGVTRAPLELIAHAVENDLPYTEILTADYVMANPMSARAYGASTEFVMPKDVHEFKPSKIVDYYRSCEGRAVEDREFGSFVVDSGPCATNFPHAGVLSDKIFLRRYPTTATNRNRARARWTYYHFLGLDVEKSASRTTDPTALADTNNPTMNNPACTVCHSVLDPVAGAFQNFGNEGDYHDQWGGLDSLDPFYKEGVPGGNAFEIEAQTEEDQEVVGVTGSLVAGENSVWLSFMNDATGGDDGDRNLHVDRIDVIDSEGDVVYSGELEDVEVAEGCNGAYGDSHFTFFCNGSLRVPVRVPSAAEYEVEVAAWADQFGNELAKLVIGINSDPYQEGDTWYRDMRASGFDGKFVPDADSSLRWLGGQIVNDQRFSEATVKFWWPAIMGREIAEPPEDASDPDFEGMLLASNAQAAEVNRLARGFRRGFHGGSPHNLKDLLVEIVLSRWFQAQSLEIGDQIREVALSGVGAKRLLVPEELARKTLAVTGF